MFPRLYSSSEQREDLVADMGEWVEGVWLFGKNVCSGRREI
jgi:hypothetical protein